MAISKLDKLKINHEGFIDVDPKDQFKISQIQESGKYMLDLKPDKDKSWIVRKNPTFGMNRAIVFASIVSAICAVFTTGMVAFNTYYIDSQLINTQAKLEAELEYLKKGLNISLNEQLSASFDTMALYKIFLKEKYPKRTFENPVSLGNNRFKPYSASNVIQQFDGKTFNTIKN